MSRSRSPLGTKPDAIEEERHRRHSVDAPAEPGHDRRETHHDIPAHGHNPSAQKGVDENPDLALHYSHEHQHKHLHHGRPSLSGRHDEVLYADGATFDRPNVNDPGPQDYIKHHLRSERADEKDFVTMDTEKGAIDPSRTETTGSEVEGKGHRLPRIYSKYKIFVHLFIWLVFTG